MPRDTRYERSLRCSSWERGNGGWRRFRRSAPAGRLRAIGQEVVMLWCLLGPAALCAALGVAALTLDLRALRPPRLAFRTVLRGCLAGSLILIAGGLAALAAVIAPWLPS